MKYDLIMSLESLCERTGLSESNVLDIYLDTDGDTVVFTVNLSEDEVDHAVTPTHKGYTLSGYLERHRHVFTVKNIDESTVPNRGSAL